MRKLLLGTAAIALGATFVAGDANAQVSLELGGHAKLYGVWLDQDERPDDPDTAPTTALLNDESLEVRDFDMARDTEIHFTGETTLDNGLTVGFHTEAHTDGSNTVTTGADTFDVEESYAYFSGAWGRVNVGAEDGAVYLLQVAAPSADSNVDGLRQYVNPINHAALSYVGSLAGNFPDDSVGLADIFGGGAAIGTGALNAIIFDAGAAGTTAGDVRLGANRAVIGTLTRRLDYDQATSGYENKLTYMTPVFNGFQAGVSYTPELGSNAGNAANDAGGTTAWGNSLDDTVNDYGEVWEIAGRWEGMIDQVGIALGGGFSHTELEQDAYSTADGGCGDALWYVDLNGDADCTPDEVKASLSDREAWNVGIDLDWKAFGLGGGYTEDDNGVSGDEAETETWFVGLDYTTGPFKIGGSYLSQDQAIAGGEVEQDRWTAGVIYTYGPGMTFRGSVSFYDVDENLGETTNDTNASSSADATSVLLGTQINF